MTKAISWFMELVVSLLPLIVRAEDGTIGGSEKKAKVLEDIMASLKDPNIPFNMPKFVSEPVLRWVVGMLIDFLVSQLNKSGFFVK